MGNPHDIWPEVELRRDELEIEFQGIKYKSYL